MAYNQNLKIDSLMGIDYSARLFGIVFSDIRLEFLERHTYAYQFIHVTKNNADYNTIIFFIGGRTWYFVLNVIICLFSGGGMVMWTNTHCFDFFFHVILYILSQYVQNYRPLPHPHLY